MYINFELYRKKGLVPEDIYYLVGIKQLDETTLEWLSSERKVRFDEMGLLTAIKGKPKQEDCYKVRLSKKGKSLINSLSTDSLVTETEDILYEWLSKYYLEKGKEVGNPNRVKKLLSWFANETNIRKNDLIKLFVDFLNDEYVDEASRVLEFTLFYPKKFTVDKGKTVAYEAKPDIYDSWLYKHFDKNRERLISTFDEYEC